MTEEIFLASWLGIFMINFVLIIVLSTLDKISTDVMLNNLLNSFIPVLQLYTLVKMICIAIKSVYKHFNKKVKIKSKKKKRNSINTLKQCTSCKMIVRSGYIEKNVCPACETQSTFYDYDERFKPNPNMFFQQKIRSVRDLEKKKMLENYNEQEAIYQKILEEKLKNKAEVETN